MTDIKVELVEYKAGRLISDLQFLVRPKVQQELPFPETPKPVDLALIARASRLGVHSDRAEALQEEFESEHSVRDLDALEKRITSGFPGPLRDHHRYLRSLMPGEAKRASEHREVEAAKADPHSAHSQELQAKWQPRWAEEWLRERLAAMLEEIQGFSVGAG